MEVTLFNRWKKFLHIRGDNPRSFFFWAFGRLGLIVIGCFVSAVGMNVFINPAQFVSGGISGIATILYYEWGTPLSVTTLALNIPLFIFSYYSINIYFLLLSLFAVTVHSGFLEMTKDWSLLFTHDDNLLNALFGGGIYGAGLGLVLKNRGSFGGTNIISILLYNRYNINIGSSGLFFNVVIIMLSLFFFESYLTLYALMAAYFSSKMIDTVLLGLDNRKEVQVFSNKASIIAQLIQLNLKINVSVVKHYPISSIDPNHKKHSQAQEIRYVLYTVIPSHRIAALKDILRSVDQGAFVTINNIGTVMGQWSPPPKLQKNVLELQRPDSDFDIIP